jgi:hypothetical protein
VTQTVCLSCQLDDARFDADRERGRTLAEQIVGARQRYEDGPDDQALWLEFIDLVYDDEVQDSLTNVVLGLAGIVARERCKRPVTFAEQYPSFPLVHECDDPTLLV